MLAGSRPDRRRVWLLAAALLLCATLLAAGSARRAAGTGLGEAVQVGPSPCLGKHWVGVWAASPSDANKRGTQPLAGRTVRTVIAPLGSGSTVRVRLSNRLGSSPFVIRAASLAKQAAKAGLVAGSVRPLSFGGKPSVRVRAHATVVSDPVHLSFHTLEHLSVSLYLGRGSTGLPTKHADGRETSYLSSTRAGNTTKRRVGKTFATRTRVRFLVSGVEAWVPRTVGAVATFGDSITDGFQGTRRRPLGIDRDVRYPDFLARRLGKRKPVKLAVLNTGISGNRLLRGPFRPFYGPRGISRLGPDVLGLPGVRNVIVLEGINDIHLTGADAKTVIRGLHSVLARLRSAGRHVLLGTLTPTGGYATRSQQRVRRTVNHWIRGQHLADAVIDFDRALRSRRHPNRMRSRYDSGDHLHPSTRGYAAMAAAVPLAELDTGCDRGH